jgi:aspartate aminotransferase
MYDRESLEAVARVLGQTPITVVSDDIYHKLVYDGEPFLGLLDVAPELRKQTVIVNGVSKIYAMTGWRIGYAAGPEPIISAMERLQSQSTSNPTSFAQKAAAAALTGPQDCVGEMVHAFAMRRDTLVRELNTLPGVHCPMPRGAFYAFPNVSDLYGTMHGRKEIPDGLALAGYLLHEARVAVVPGAPFGATDHVRLSYAASLDTI